MVRTVFCFLVWCSVLLSGGCAIWEIETTNRGGYLDHLADRYWLKADSKSMRALRAFAIQVSLARIASVSEKNEADRQLLARRIGATTARFLPVYACAFENNPLQVAGAENDPCFYYDSAMVNYATALFDLAMVALPIEDARRLMNSTVGTVVNPLNVINVLESLISIGRFAFKHGRVVGALYRDTVELEVQVWLTTPEIDRRPPGVRVTEADVAALREVYDRKSDDLLAWIAGIDALRSRGLEPVPHDKFFGQLGALMGYLCDLITQKGDASKECKSGLLDSPLARMPLLGSLNRPVIGTMIGTTGVGSRLRPSDGRPAERKPPGPVLTCPPTQGTFDTADENATKLNDYLRTGAEEERATRVKNLEELLALPDIRSKLIPGRTPRLVTVLNMVECNDVRSLMSARAMEKGFIK